jgi:hypothetical protein
MPVTQREMWRDESQRVYLPRERSEKSKDESDKFIVQNKKPTPKSGLFLMLMPAIT